LRRHGPPGGQASSSGISRRAAAITGSRKIASRSITRPKSLGAEASPFFLRNPCHCERFACVAANSGVSASGRGSGIAVRRRSKDHATSASDTESRGT